MHKSRVRLYSDYSCGMAYMVDRKRSNGNMDQHMDIDFIIVTRFVD